MLWNFLQRFQLTSRKPTSLSPDTMEGTPVGAEVSAKLSPPPPKEQESDYRREFCKRIYEIDTLESPKCKVQMSKTPP
jgi:hypothetical protein